MMCLNPVRIYPDQKRSEKGRLPMYPDGIEVPCGVCLQCRIARRNEWTMRLYHELGTSSGVFVTLTYSDDYLPDNSSLKKVDLQNFFKRLRKSLGDRRIKYYACGEYGDDTERPHYHAIIFNMSLSQEDKCRIMDAWPFCDWSQPSIRRNSFGLAELDSIRYVAQYIDKKLGGDYAKKEYIDRGREPVFCTSSNGIGLEFALANADQLSVMGYVTLRGVPHSMPRYYASKLGLSRDVCYKSQTLAQIEFARKLIGRNLDTEDAYRMCKPTQVKQLEEAKKLIRRQRDIDNKAKIDLKSARSKHKV